MHISPQYLETKEGVRLAYEYIPGKLPGVVFFTGFMSDMTGTKATSLAELCRQSGHAFLRFDYRGHGQSSGNVLDCDLSCWLDDAINIFDSFTTGPQILVGSSLGGWIATLLGRARKEKLASLITIAPALDFTEDLLWDRLSPEEQHKLQQEGIIFQPQAFADIPHGIAWRFIEDGRRHLLLRDAISLNAPVRILQGMLDNEIPWKRSLRFVEKLTSQDVKLTLIKDGDHRLVREQDIQLLQRTVEEFIN